MRGNRIQSRRPHRDRRRHRRLREIEATKPYLKPVVLHYEQYLLGQDPTNVERVMLRIRRLGSFKPWGSAVSAIEMALWDLAGKIAGLPVYKLLGGRVRDRVRVYNGGIRFPLSGHKPADYAANMTLMKNAVEGFTIIKQAIGYHGPMAAEFPGFSYSDRREGGPHPSRGPLTERGLDHIRVPGRQTRLVVRNRRRPSRSARPGRAHRRLGPPRDGRPPDSGGGRAAPVGGRQEFLRLTGRRQSTMTEELTQQIMP